MQGLKRDSKFNARSSLCRLNHSHRSQLETAVCELIQLRQSAKELELVQVEDTILLSGWYKYIPDFKCKDLKTGDFFWIEAKGYADGRWPSTKKGWKHAGPGKLEIWRGAYHSPYLDEILIPRGIYDPR